MNQEYFIHEKEEWRTATRDCVQVFQVRYRNVILATYTTRAAAELVISALRAAQTDLK